MAKKLTFKRPIESVYYYDGRTSINKKADFKGHSITPHGAKKAAYKHLDTDYGDARKVIITDLRTGLELWHMHCTAKGDIICNEISAKTQQIVESDKKEMKKLGKRF
jgi:hypothetical protein